MKFILGTKLDMTQVFLPNGNVMAVTAVQAGPCTITQVKGEADGYQAVQIGFGQTKRLFKALSGHLRGLPKHRWLREFRVAAAGDLQRGQIIDVSTFAKGDELKVISVSKGRGFQGVVKRHHFAGHPASHGHKDQARMPGSIGATEPQHVFKGTRMGGRMGGDQVTINSAVIDIDEAKNIIYVKGAVPGARNGLVLIQAEGELKVKQPEVSKQEAVVSSQATEVKTEKIEEIKETIKDETVVTAESVKVEEPAVVEEKVTVEEPK